MSELSASVRSSLSDSSPLDMLCSSGSNIEVPTGVKMRLCLEEQTCQKSHAEERQLSIHTLAEHPDLLPKHLLHRRNLTSVMDETNVVARCALNSLPDHESLYIVSFYELHDQTIEGLVDVDHFCADRELVMV